MKNFNELTQKLTKKEQELLEQQGKVANSYLIELVSSNISNIEKLAEILQKHDTTSGNSIQGMTKTENAKLLAETLEKLLPQENYEHLIEKLVDIECKVGGAAAFRNNSLALACLKQRVAKHLSYPADVTNYSAYLDERAIKNIHEDKFLLEILYKAAKSIAPNNSIKTIITLLAFNLINSIFMEQGEENKKNVPLVKEAKRFFQSQAETICLNYPEIQEEINASKDTIDNFVKQYTQDLKSKGFLARFLHKEGIALVKEAEKILYEITNKGIDVTQVKKLKEIENKIKQHIENNQKKNSRTSISKSIKL